MPSKKLPKISIVTPSYNQGEFLEETIQSVLNQKYPNLEYIIMDGGSTDQSVEIIRKYEQYLAYWVSEKDRGQAHAINKGFIRATGDILAWLNSDDFYYPNTLNYIAQAYQKYPEAGLYIGNGNIVDKHRNIIRPFSDSIGFDANTLIDGQNYINQPSVFINRKALDKAGLLDESLNNEFDVEYWIRTGREFEAVVMDEFLSAFRWYDEIKTASSGFNRWVEMYRVRQRYTDKPLTPGLLVEFFHIARNEPLLNEMGKDIKGIIEKAYELTFARNQEKLNLTNNVPAGRGIYFIPDKNLTPPVAEQKISAPPLVHHTGSKPKVDIVLQATGTHSWGVYGGWANAAHKLGILNRVFTPKGQWGSTDVTDDNGLWSYLLNPQADIMLLPGFDWHSQMLHTSGKWQDRWVNANIRKILFSHEAIEKSCILFDNTLMKTAAHSAAHCVNGIVHIDLNDTDFWKQMNKPLLCQVLGVDERIFSIQKRFGERIARPFFRGQITPHFTSKTYDQRREFMQFLIDNNAVEVLDYIKGQKPDKVVEDFNNYQIAVNLPTLSAYHPSRVTEALACGCALITNRTGIAQLDNLFTDRQDLLYYSTKEELLEAVRLLSSNREFSEQLSQKGHEQTLEHFTLDKLLIEILHWANSSDISQGTIKERIENFIRIKGDKKDIRPVQSDEHENKNKIIIDGVTFYMQQGRPLGISRVWKSLLTELSYTPLADRVLLLDRDSTAPFIPGIRWKTIKGYDHINFEDDSLYLEEICREENASLFISTYYTYPENSRCAIVLHDMIPELTGMDLSLPEWRAKAKAIEKAHAYFSVSASTMNDFRKLYPHYSHKNKYLVHNAVSEEFKQNSLEEIISFKKKYNILKHYFMIVGHRSLYKNAHLFFRAFSLLENKADYEILCTGGAKELEKVFLPYIKETRCQVNFLSDRDLSIAYSGAIALVYPSQYEGFGLPILEAMQSGCPVITCRNSSIPEIAGESVMYVDAHDVAGMRDALIKIQEPYIRETYIARGIENAKRFSWGNSCTQFVSGVREIISTMKDASLNPTDSLNTLSRLFFVLKKRPDCSDLITAMTRLKEMFTESKEMDISSLLKAENSVSDMKTDIFALIKQGASNADENESLLYYWCGLALEKRELLKDSLSAYIKAGKGPDLLKWRVKYLASDVAYRLGNYESSIQFLKEILAAHPAFTEGRQRLKAIEEEFKHKKALQEKTQVILPALPEQTKQEDQNSKIRDSVITPDDSRDRIVIATNLVPFKDQGQSERQQESVKSISNLMKSDIIPLNICYTDEFSQPPGWQVAPLLKRSSNLELKIDGKRKPFVTDLFDIASEWAQQKHINWFALSNSDIIFTARLIDEVRRLLKEGFETIAISRFDIESVDPDTKTFSGQLEIKGYDIFVLKTDWWRKNHKLFQPYIFGEIGWDNAFAAIMASHSKFHILQSDNLCYHFTHQKTWLTGPYTDYNMSLYNGPDRNYTDKYMAFITDIANTMKNKDKYLLSSHETGELITKHFQTQIKVSAIISAYNSEKFIRGCLEDLINQTLYEKGELEIVVVDSGSEENERDVVNKFQQQHENIIYVRTEKRETVYGAWNRGIKASRVIYITNANTDDRHRKDALEVMAQELDKNPDIALVYGDQIITETENETFDKCTPVGYFNWPDYDRVQLFHCPCVGPQPMWRKSLHQEFGYFDESLKVAGDYDWWLRISEKYSFRHFPELLGLYFLSPQGIEASNEKLSYLETGRVRKLHGEKADITCDFSKYRMSYRVSDYPLISRNKKEQEQKINPMISVIVPTFNRPEMLKETLDSILNQTYKDFEIVVVNDAGVDVEDMVAEKNHGGNIIHIKHSTNKGLAGSRNTGINAANGKYIAYLDDDDIFYPEHLKTLVNFLESSDYRAAYTDAYRAYQAGENGKYIIKKRELTSSSDFDYNRILISNYIPVLCFMHEKSCLDEVGLFDEALTSHEDWDLWIRMSRKFQFGHIRKITAEYRFRTDGSTMFSGRRADMLRTMEVIHAKHSFAGENPSIVQARSTTLGTLRHEVFNTRRDTVSIIIPTFDNLKLTRQCVDAIRQTADNIAYEIIVVDNNSSDGTPDYLLQEEAAGRINAIMNKENLGFSKANNQGAKIAKGKYLLFLNNDTIPQPYWLEEMVQLAESDANIGIVGSKLLYPDESIQHAGIVFYKTRKPYHIYKGLPADIPCANKQRDYQIVTAACMLVRKELYFEVGGFDERYRNGCEDIDLCLKVREKNKRVVYNPKSVVMHLEAQSKGRQVDMDSNRQLFENLWKDKIVPDDTDFLEQDGMERLVDPEGSFRFKPKTKMNELKVSVIIVTFNSATTIRACIDSVLKHTPDTEVIVVDNASSDNTQTILREYETGKLITTIINNDNKGFSYACNQGIRASSGEYLILLNPDTVVTPLWADRMLAHFRPGVGAVGPLSNYVNLPQFAQLYAKEELREHTLADDLSEKLYLWNRGQEKETRLLMGFCIALPREVLDKAGLLDEDLFLGSEDLEISWRLRQKGYKLIIATDTFIYHEGQVSFKSVKEPPSTQESAEKLYQKLEAHYGKGNVPHPMELWGIDYFKPKGASFRSLKPTFAAVYCVYDDVAWLEDSIESIYHAVDAVYFLVSDRPWYGQQTDNRTTLKHIMAFPDPYNKINIVEGTWTNETDQRNAGLEIIKDKGYTYCFVIDADEIYEPAELNRMIDLVISNPKTDCWHISLDTYWKSYRYRIEPREPLKPPVFVKAGEVRFTQNRLAAGKNHAVIPPDIGICHHLSYAHSDDEILKKISTFSHAHEVIPGWFEKVWKRWDSDHSMRNIHPTHPQAYQQAVEQPYSLLPPVLKRRYLKDDNIGGNIIPGLSSIIILAHNEWAQTELCINSIEEHTPEPYEIIVVDNGSTDETCERLCLLTQKKTNMKVIRNNNNLGFAAGNNQGIAISKGEYILLLNNDTIVTESWLRRMLDVFVRYPETAIVGPMSNYVNGPQLIPQVDYKKTEDINAFALKWGKEHEGESFPIYRVVGFCLLTKREVIDRIGGLDERFGSGNFEDDDFCVRASLAGYNARIARDVFIHHTGSQTFKSAKIDFHKSLTHNWELFKTKWRIPAHVPYGIGYQMPAMLPAEESLYLPLPYLPSDHKTDERSRWWEETRQKEQRKRQVEVKVKENKKGLTSIVFLLKNQQEYTRKCIQSIQQHTKEPYEIILVPENNSYAPPKWLRKLIKEHSNYKLVTNNGKTGFARRCNHGIHEASGEYIVIFDDSVTVTEDWLSGLLECLNSSPDTGIVGPMTINIDGRQRVLVADNNLLDNLEGYARSFRERNRYRRVQAKYLDSFCMIFAHALTEKIGVLDERFQTHEYADDDYCLRAALEGFRNIIAGDVFVHYNGHKNLMITGTGSPVVRDKRTFSEKWGDIEEIRPESKKLFSTNTLFVADEADQKGQKEKAVVTLIEGIKINPDDSRLHYAIADILIEDKKFRDALDILERMPEEIKRQPESLELFGYCKEGMGLYDDAESYADEVLQLNKASARAWNLKGVIAFKKNLYANAEKFLLMAIESDRGFGEACSNLGALRWINGNREEALKLFEKGFIFSPVLGDVVTNYYTAVVSLSKLSEAEILFQEAISLYPMNRRLKFILIDNLLQQKKFNEAMKELEEAMAIFGIDDDTLLIALNLRDKVGALEIDKTSPESISLCMIVKNEEDNIIRSLQSAKPLVNEVIIVDTGSTDRTRNIARAFGAKIYDLPWTNDFSAARNFALSKANCNWILVLDADEVISPLDFSKLKELVKNSATKKAAYSIVTRNYVIPVSVNWHPNDGQYKEETGSGWFPSAKVRLFPNDSRARFEKPVHETVEDSLKRIGIEIRDSDIPIHHYGKLNREEIQAKGEEYYQLGKKKLKEQGEYDPAALYELAIQASELEKYDESLEFWKKLLAVKPDFVKAIHGMGTCYFQLGRYEEAIDTFKKALKLEPDSKDPGVMYATSELFMGNPEAAISYLEGLLKKNPMYPLALLAITAAYFCSGKKAKGLEYVRKVEKTQFSLAHYLKDIAKLLISVKRFDFAISLLEAAIETGNALNETHQLIAECYGKQKDSSDQGLKDSSEIMKKKHLTAGTLETLNPGILSLCMIVKNEEAKIERSLLSIKPVVDEMIVVDTGSSDRTKDIARKLGAKVYDFPWTDDFSEARNFSLSKASCKWILILDADEVISPLDHEKLRKLLKEKGPRSRGFKDSSENLTDKNSTSRTLEPLNPANTAFSFVTRNYIVHLNTAGWIANEGKYMNEEAGSGWYPAEKVRLFPRSNKIRFEYPIHERIEPSLLRSGIKISQCDIPIHHYGDLNRGKADVKAEHYYMLGKRKLEESGGQDERALYELALQGAELEKYEEALEFLQKAISLKPDFHRAYQSAGNIHFNLGKHKEALFYYKKALELNPDSRDSLVMYATCLIYTGKAEESVSLLKGLLRNDPAYMHAMLLLAEAYLCTGKKKEALGYVKRLRDMYFDAEKYLTEFAKILISIRRLDYAVSLLHGTAEINAATDETYQLLAECNQMPGKRGHQ